jgi:hypothetical protein
MVTPEAKCPITWRSASGEPGTPKADADALAGYASGQLALVTR